MIVTERHRGKTVHFPQLSSRELPLFEGDGPSTPELGIQCSATISADQLVHEKLLINRRTTCRPVFRRLLPGRRLNYHTPRRFDDHLIPIVREFHFDIRRSGPVTFVIKDSIECFRVDDVVQWGVKLRRSNPFPARNLVDDVFARPPIKCHRLNEYSCIISLIIFL